MLAKILLAIDEWLEGIFLGDKGTPNNPMPDVPPQPPQAPTVNANSDTLQWGTQEEARHSIRVLCDENGISYSAKQIITACIYQESAFLVNPKPNQNRDPKTGALWSTDYGIVQVNDHYHIGHGKDFPSVEYVISHPKECVQYMIDMYREGKIGLWSSYKTGAFRRWLPYVNTPIPTSGHYPA